MAAALQTRSVRNNNPGNLRIGIAWDGLCPRASMTAAQLAETDFCVFVSPAWGFRALAVNMRTAWSTGLRSVRELIFHYAPANENPTEAYIQAVCKMMQVASFLPLNLDNAAQLESLCKAVATVEAGGWDGFWKDDDLNTGINLALFEPTTPAPAAS